MEVDQIENKFPRISNGQKMEDQFRDGGGGENKRCIPNVNGRGGGVDLSGGVGRFYGWPSSRIVRVSRASGGKDRHSKVLTSKGLRDRRVRLSVNTAINFYDLQDRLGYDQPSKAVEWLLKAAASSISELPPINSPFPETPTQLSDEKRLGFDSAEVEMDGGDGDLSHLQQQQVTKSSACSSTSETSKNSGLSLSRSGNRIKARDRAKERVAEKENESSHVASLNPISETTSFTELLSGGINNINNSPKNEFQKTPRQQWSSTTMDYFSSGLLGPQGQMQFVNELKPVASELQNYSFAPDSNLNFTISSAYSGGAINRGTLQSNSSSSSMLPHHIQRFSQTDGSSNNFFIGATPPVENNHHFFSGLQLYNGDAHANNGRQKGKGKNS